MTAKNHPSKINQEIANQIRLDYADLGPKELAIKYNVTKTIIYSILRNDTYKILTNWRDEK